MTSGSNQIDSDTGSVKEPLRTVAGVLRDSSGASEYMQACAGVELPQELQAISGSVATVCLPAISPASWKIFTKQESAAIYDEGGKLIHAPKYVIRRVIKVPSEKRVSLAGGSLCSINSSVLQERTMPGICHRLSRRFCFARIKKNCSATRVILPVNLRRARVRILVSLRKTWQSCKESLQPLEGTVQVTNLIVIWNWKPGNGCWLSFTYWRCSWCKSISPDLKKSCSTSWMLHKRICMPSKAEMRSAQTGCWYRETLIHLFATEKGALFIAIFKRPLSLIVLELESVPAVTVGGKAQWLPSQRLQRSSTGSFD